MYFASVYGETVVAFLLLSSLLASIFLNQLSGQLLTMTAFSIFSAPACFREIAERTQKAEE